MEESIKLFISYLAKKKGYSSNTLAAYLGDLNQLGAYVGAERSKDDVDAQKADLDSRLLAGYMRSLRERNYTASTVARKIAAVKSFIQFMVDNGKLRSDLVPILVSPQVSKPVPKPLSISEVRLLLGELAESSTPEAKRDRAMVELLYATGLRASELMALNVKDVDLKLGKVRCLGRNYKTRFIPIDRDVAQLLGDYISSARANLLSNEAEVALFTNRRGERLTRQGFWQIVQGYADKVGLGVKVTPRSLRHSFAVHKLKSGADLQSVQELMGHAHISTTRAYKQAEVRD
jgi:integrase/recombinase XerD